MIAPWLISRVLGSPLVDGRDDGVWIEEVGLECGQVEFKGSGAIARCDLERFYNHFEDTGFLG